MKTKKPIKARRMYLHTYIDGYDIFSDWREAQRRADQVIRMEGDGPRQSTVGVIDLSDSPALVEQVAKVIGEKLACEGMDAEEAALVNDTARDVLSSLGLIPARRRKG